MPRIGAKTYELHDGDPDIGDTITIKPASDQSVMTVLAANPDIQDGLTRSEWLWVRLPNGDLILGIYPQDGTYFATEKDHP